MYTGVKIFQWEGAIFRGKGRPIVKYRDGALCASEDFYFAPYKCAHYGRPM